MKGHGDSADIVGRAKKYGELVRQGRAELKGGDAAKAEESFREALILFDRREAREGMDAALQLLRDQATSDQGRRVAGIGDPGPGEGTVAVNHAREWISSIPSSDEGATPKWAEDVQPGEHAGALAVGEQEGGNPLLTAIRAFLFGLVPNVVVGFWAFNFVSGMHRSFQREMKAFCRGDRGVLAAALLVVFAMMAISAIVSGKKALGRMKSRGAFGGRGFARGGILLGLIFLISACPLATILFIFMAH